MEPLFSNTCIYTMSVLQEMNRALVSVGYRIYCVVAATLFFILGLIYNRTGQMVYSAIFYAACAFMLYMVSTKASSTAKKMYKNYQKQYGSNLETHLFFYENEIIGSTKQIKGAVKTYYTDVTTVTETANLYLLKIKSKSVIVAAKNGFIADNSEEFRGFLIEKCVNAKFK